MLAPFLAKVFFIDNTVASLLKIYSVPIITIFMAPIGAIIFGKLILIWGPARTLISSLTGVSICTMIMGILPTYEQVGVWAPLLLIILRAIQAIFSAGESEVSSLFVIEKAMRKSFVSSLYSCSSILGFTCASCVAYLVSKTSDPLSYWRYAFIGGLFTGLANLWLRYISNKNLELLETKSPPKINWTKAYPIILKVILINGSNFLNFVVAFVGMNVLIPLFTKHTTADMLWLNNILLVFDILLLPFFGWLGDRFGALNIMLISSLTMTITIIPLFYVLPFSTLGQIAIIRMIVIIPGLAFAAQTRVWFYGLCQEKDFQP
jgi:MFS family permease